ncbi:hypothetical protein STBHUCCB_p1600 (plasmid) [Salmonella enterica subsp. enterica serovar Typhi str. P-stx-12]|uniref:Uncharacterized protein n=1 Tax=Escherichia coli TaxID=562 RepID=A0A6G6AMK4_ECOLX|nr:hypothetical protein STBHUCCB_p1600 [Salmonella enterica subsp. enterica serovar Typhi str. P-stx-12]QID23015.1 hypothetical protein [Escherichia coli]QID23475.1 hypothetical protein [Escherichia coli]UWM22298.1 hypothetical protein [Klebsiella pneumoniae]
MIQGAGTRLSGGYRQGVKLTDFFVMVLRPWFWLVDGEVRGSGFNQDG